MRRNLDFYKPQAQRTNFWAPQQGGRKLRSTRKILAKYAILTQKRPKSVSLRGRTAAVAILKSKVWHPVAKHGSAKQEEIPITKNMDSLRRFASSFFISRFCFVPRNHSSFRDGKSFRLRLPRRAQKLRPPRNDKIDRLGRKHGTQNSIFGFRKNVSYLLPDFDGSGLF